jgi:hypothetical protein
MRKFAVILAALVLVAGAAWIEILPITGFVIDLTCSASAPSAACQSRMRSLGHLWSQRGNLEKARVWYARAAEAGDVAAMFHLGWVYQQTAEAELRGDTEGRAAIAGLASPDVLSAFVKHVEAQAQPGRRLDILTQLGFSGPAGGFAEHALLAAAWYRLAAEFGFAPAMNNLGELYRHGLIGDDKAAARDWFVAAASAGNPSGYWNAWVAFSSGPERDPAQLAKWSRWVGQPGSAPDLLEPTFGRTTVFGRPLPPEERAAYRQAAAAGTPMTINLQPMQPNPQVPTFRQRTGVDPSTR